MSLYKSEFKSTWYWDLSVPFIQFWGILTATVVCGVGVDFLLHDNLMGVYVIIVASIVFLLEVTWVLRHCIKECKVLEMVSNLKSWKKSLMFLPFSVVLLLKPHRVWLSSIAGAMLMVLAFLHIVLCFQNERGRKKEKGLLDNEEGCGERNEAVIFEILDNGIKPIDEILVEEPGGNVLDI